jgi:hypothetical protein
MTYPTDVTPEFFYGGMTLQEYLAGMTKNRELFEANYDNFKLSEGELTALAAVNGTRHILVITEDWCSDSLRYLPALARMAEAAGNWDIRFFYRDAHLDLASNWLKHGTRSAIPVIVLFDEEWNEAGCFVEKPDQVYEEEADARLVFAAAYPDLPDAALPASEMTPHTLDIFAPYMRGFRLTNTQKWQHLFVAELLARLQSAAIAEGAGCW